MTGLEYIGRRDLHPLWDGVRDPIREDVADAYEQGKADGYHEGIDVGAVLADTHPRWISVKEEMPKEDVFVLVVCDDYVNIARRHENRWQLGFGTKTANHLIYTPYNKNITHWLPMPALPPVSKSENAHIIGTVEHIQVALDVMDKKGGE